MKTIDRYIIKKFLLTFVFMLGILIVIAIVFDFAEKIDDFINHNAPLSAIVNDYYANFIPYFMNLFSPLIVFLSAIYFTSRMAYNTEFVAILSSGTSFYRLLIPYMFVSLLLASLSFYLHGWVIPEGNKVLVEFESKYINKPYLKYDHNIHKQARKDEFAFLRNYNNKKQSGNKFTYEKFDGNVLKEKLFADHIEWIDSLQHWEAHRYIIRYLDSMKERIVRGDTIVLDLPLKPEAFEKNLSNIHTLNNKELSKMIDELLLRGDSIVASYQIEKYQRTSMPFATFIMVLIAMTIATRKVRGGTGLHLGLGLLFAFSYILFQQFSHQFAIQSDLNPAVAVWIPNMFFAAVGSVLLIFAQK